MGVFQRMKDVIKVWLEVFSTMLRNTHRCMIYFMIFDMHRDKMTKLLTFPSFHCKSDTSIVLLLT